MGRLILVRHGQASWGAADYDLLCERGHEQARATGRLLGDLRPRLVVHGSLRRQRETAESLVAAAGWAVPTRSDPRWNEMDHDAAMARVPGPADGDTDPTAYQRRFEAATDRWLDRRHDAEYAEPFPAFAARVRAALTELPRDGEVVVISSGGPIAAVTAELIDGGRSAYRRLATVVVNASVSTVVAGRRGLSLVSFNEHAHLSGELLTYR